MLKSRKMLMRLGVLLFAVLAGLVTAEVRIHCARIVPLDRQSYESMLGFERAGGMVALLSPLSLFSTVEDGELGEGRPTTGNVTIGERGDFYRAMVAIECDHVAVSIDHLHTCVIAGDDDEDGAFDSAIFSVENKNDPSVWCSYRDYDGDGLIDGILLHKGESLLFLVRRQNRFYAAEQIADDEVAVIAENGQEQTLVFSDGEWIPKEDSRDGGSETHP